MPLYISPPPSHPVTRFLLALVGLLVMVGAFMLGLVALAVVAGLGLVAGVIVWLRIAWIRRKLRREGFIPEGKTSTEATDSNEVLEAEYTVIRTRREQ